jgi:hypothetical protein
VNKASARATLRALRRRVEDAARERFGKHFPLRVYLDTSDGDPALFDACIQYIKRPPEAADSILFPVNDVVTDSTEEKALAGLLRAIESKAKT